MKNALPAGLVIMVKCLLLLYFLLNFTSFPPSLGCQAFISAFVKCMCVYIYICIVVENQTKLSERGALPLMKKEFLYARVFSLPHSILIIHCT